MNQITCGTRDSIELTKRMCDFFHSFFYLIITELFKDTKLHSKSTWIKKWSWCICKCLSFFQSERERLLEQTACIWCLMWPSKGGGDGGSSFVNSFCRLPVGNRAAFVWEITVISVSSGLKSAWNNGTDCKLHSKPAEEFHLALLCSDTQRSCVLNPYQSYFPLPLFHLEKAT